MKNILHIFKRDLLNIRKNRAAIVVIVAVMFLPSLYAWFNIIPSWDPYANTSGVKVAVANLDEGTEVKGRSVKVGDEIVLSLLENDKLGWQFVNEEEAMRGVEHGDYYASIIIPKDFSEKLTSVITDNPEKPVLDYYINEKINAIAPKVTGAGASAIVESIQSGFVKVANEAIFNVFNEVGLELEVNRASIEKVRESVFRLEGELPEIERILGTADQNLVRVEEAIDKANDGMAKAEEISEQAEVLSAKISEMLREGDRAVHQYVPIVKQDLRRAQKAVQQIPSVADRMTEKGADIDKLLDQVEQGAGKLTDGSEALGNLADMLEETNAKLAEQTKVEALIDSLESESEKLDALKQSVQETIEALGSGEHIGIEVAEKVDDAAKNVVNRIDRITVAYETSVIPSIEDEIERIREHAPKVKETFVTLQEANASLLDKLPEWQETGGPIDVTAYKENIETVLPVVQDNLDRVNAALRIFNRVHEISGGRLLERPIAALTNVQEKLESAENLLSTTLGAIERGEEISGTVGQAIKENLEAIDARLDQLIRFSETDVVNAFNDAIAKLEKMKTGIRDQLADLKQTADNMSELGGKLLGRMQEPEKALQILQNMADRIDSGQATIQSLIETNERIQKRFDAGLFDKSLDRLASMQQDLTQFHENIVEAVGRARVSKGNVGYVIQSIKEKSIEMDKTIGDLLRFIDNDLMPKYEQASARANNALKEGDRMLAKASAYFPRIYELLEKAEAGVDTGKDGLKKANELFPEAKEKVREIAGLIRRLEEKGDLDQLIDLMKNDPTAESEFFAEPILLAEHELFPMPNYGSAMAPFFTTMSLWVGGLILVSSLIVDVPNKHLYKSYEAYFGRFLTFWMIGLMQAFIVTMGNLFLLKTFVAHKLLFVLFALFVSTTFITIVYTLVSVFGNTGKVLGIILLVMQLGASGGTFPIQMTPAFFQKIHAFLPFTHALKLMREAVGGVIWPVVWKHVLCLVAYIAVFLFIGIGLKERINKSSDQFIEKARESEIVL